MLLTIKTAVAASAISVAAPTQAAIVTIDFESFSRGDRVVAGTDIGGGLTLDRDIGFDDRGFLQNPPATQGIVAFAPSPVNFQGDDVAGFFASAVDFLQIGAGDVNRFDTDVITLTAFDSNNAVVGTSSFQNNTGAEFLTITGAGITSFYLDIDDIASGQLDQNGSAGFDNISFNVTPVPVPASLPLLGAGMLAFGFAARRRNKAK